MIRRDTTYTSAAHEAGHAIVAHALGRHVLLIRIGRVELPVGHPSNPLDVVAVAGGFHLAGPSLTAEINERLRAGDPFTADQLGWLRSEMVVALAGRIAESLLTGHANVDARAMGDLIQAGTVARALWKVEEQPYGELTFTRELLSKANRTARAILADLTENLTTLAGLLATLPQAEYAEEAIQTMIGDLGSPKGTHWQLLATLVDPRIRSAPIDSAGMSRSKLISFPT